MGNVRELGELGLIRRIRASGPAPAAGVRTGIGDDTAVLEPTPGRAPARHHRPPGRGRALSPRVRRAGRHRLEGARGEHLRHRRDGRHAALGARRARAARGDHARGDRRLLRGHARRGGAPRRGHRRRGHVGLAGRRRHQRHAPGRACGHAAPAVDGSSRRRHRGDGQRSAARRPVSPCSSDGARRRSTRARPKSSRRHICARCRASPRGAGSPRSPACTP